ncbi:hypothetical protein B0H19DRAFT_1190466 [Mycena capillaripes]|nr:hypothetical protein B0H19DRAFT_1190466 [Mycena capillaripes]
MGLQEFILASFQEIIFALCQVIMLACCKCSVVRCEKENGHASVTSHGIMKSANERRRDSNRIFWRRSETGDDPQLYWESFTRMPPSARCRILVEHPSQICKNAAGLGNVQ